ncbi:MAG: BrxA family protein [Polyangiaceae bacterium]
MQIHRPAAHRIAPPALAEEPYTARAIKGTALLEEMRALLRAWQPGEPFKAFRLRALGHDPLGKATGARLDDVLRVFEARFFTDGAEPATSVRRLLASRGNGRWFSQLCLLFAARADVVLRDAVTQFLPAARARGAMAVATPDLVRFLSAQEALGRMARPWSQTVRESVARHVLHHLTDFGLLGAPRRGSRELLQYRPGSLAMTWLACELHRLGSTDRSILDHRDFALFQLGASDVRHELDRLSDLGLWIYQGAGSVVRISWTFREWDAVLTTLEGPSVD